MLSIRYNIPVKQRRLVDIAVEEWQRMKHVREDQRKDWTRRIESIWPNLRPGDQLTAYRQQDGPTRFYFGDRVLGEVADPMFGPAFFAIWLGPSCCR